MVTNELKYRKLSNAIDLYLKQKSITLEFIQKIEKTLPALSDRLHFFYKILTDKIIKDSKGQIPKIINQETLIYVTKRIRKTIIELEEKTITDPLTNLLNKTGLDDNLPAFMNRFEREKYEENNKAIGMVMIDVNKFKEVNDRCGHYAGDEILKICAEAIEKFTRLTDLQARVGGDEFLILLDSMDSSKSQEIAKKLTTEINDYIIENAKEKNIQNLPDVSVSIGLALYKKHSNSIMRVIECADKAMYYAKKHPVKDENGLILNYHIYNAALESTYKENLENN